MQASLTEPQARHPGYLASCPACQALNGVNAAACWRCEQALTRPNDEPPGTKPDVALAATPTVAAAGPGEAPDPGAAAGGGPQSFFPVLREEVAAQAANDGHAPDSGIAEGGAEEDIAAPPEVARGAWPRWALGAALLAVATCVGAVLLMMTPRGWTGPARVASPPTMGSSALTSIPPPARASVGVPTAAVPVISPTPTPDAPPPPPANAACTPQVVALGLCSPASR
jgi:hypothetical protein